MATESEYRFSDAGNSLFPSKVNQIRISPAKSRDVHTTRKSLRPFISSLMQDKKKVLTKDDLNKMNSKIQLIKNKCMNAKPKLGKSDSRKTMNSVWMSNEQMNDSVDLDSEDITEAKKGAKVHLIRSVFEDRPPTVYFKYPKCCGIPF
jgi:hypothetical protein